MVNFQYNLKEFDPEKIRVLKASLETLKADQSLGFLQLTDRNLQWSEATQFGKQLSEVAEKLVVVGMGGSCLGGKSLVQSAIDGPNKVEFWDSVDPDFLIPSLNALGDLSKVHWLVISKSGNTLETLRILNFVVSHLKQNKIELSKVMSIVTEAKQSKLSTFASEYSIKTLEHPIDVGGRFSALSFVGLIPAAFAGVNLEQVHQGAQRGLQDTESITKLSLEVLESWDRQEWISVFWSYSKPLDTFVFWLQQLWAESLAKQYDRDGATAKRVSTPHVCFGSRDQHSVLQQISDGADDKFLLYFTTQKSQNENIYDDNYIGDFSELGHSVERINQIEAQSCMEALKQKDRKLIQIQVSEVNAENMGYLIMLFECVIGCLGEFLNINAFDQPGVELGKKIAIRLLKKD